MVVKNSLFSILFVWIFCISHSYGQQKAGEFSVNIPGLKQALLVSGAKGEYACIGQSNKQLEISFLASDYSLINKAIVAKVNTDRNIELKGAVLKSDFIFVYAYNPKSKAIILYKVRRNSGDHSFTTVRVLSASEQLLSAFEMDTKFYFLSVPKNTNKLSVIKIDGENPEEIEYETPMVNFYASLSKNNESGNKDHSEVAIQEIASNIEGDLNASSAPKKLYHENGIIRITFDEPNMTHLLTFYIETKESDYKKLTYNLEKGNSSSQKQGNSYIYKNKLIRGTMSTEQLNLSILNLDSMTRINNYNLFPEENFTIANSPLMEENAYASGSNGSETILKNPNQYFKHVLRGNFAVTARSIDSQEVELKIGGVERYYVNRGGGPGTMGMPVSVGFGVGMGGFGMGPGMGMGMGYPFGYSPYGGYPGAFGPGHANTKITYFKSVLTSTSFDHMEGYYQSESLIKKMNDYKSKVFRSNYPDVISEVYSADKSLLGYYKKNGKKFILIEFLN